MFSYLYNLTVNIFMMFIALINNKEEINIPIIYESSDDYYLDECTSSLVE